MDARLTQNPHLGFYRKRAKELKRALAQGEADAAGRFAAHHPRFRSLSPAQIREAEPSLGDAQLVVAQEHGFASWAEFKKALERPGLELEAAAADRLLSAVRAGDQEQVRTLLVAQPELASSAASDGSLPLVEACDRGLLAIVKLLLEAGADPRRGDPLLAAAHAGPHKRGPALDVVDLLVLHGAPYDLFAKAALGRVVELEQALPSAEVDAIGPQGTTALFLAASNGHPAAVRALLAAGADPRLGSRGGRGLWQQVLLHAWSMPHRDVLRILLEFGVECTLHEACMLAHLPSVQRLLTAEPGRIDSVNQAGLTPLTIAVLNADAALARVLLDAGAADPAGQGKALVEAEPQRNKSFAGALFVNSSFERVNVHDCTLAAATFSNVNLAGARFDNVNLGEVRIDNAHIKGLTIYGIEVEPLLVRELRRRQAAKLR